MKRSLAIVLAAALLVTFVAACGSTSSLTSAQSTQSTVEEAPASQAEEASVQAAEAEAEVEQTEEEEELQTEPETEAEAEPEAEAVTLYPFSDETIELTMFLNVGDFLFQFLDETGDMSVIPALAAAAEATNVHINYSPINQSTYTDEFNLMIASQNYYDMIANLGACYSGGIDAAVNDEVALDITELMPTYAPDYLAYLDEHPTVKKSITSDEGRIIGFYQMSTGIIIGPAIRSDWLREMEMEIPKTYDELHDALSGFKNQFGADMPMSFSAQGFFDSTASDFFTDGFGITATSESDFGWFANDGEVQMSEISDGMLEYLTLARQWADEGIINMDAISLSGQDKTKMQESSRTGFFTCNVSTMTDDYNATYGIEIVPMADVSKTGNDVLACGKVSGGASTNQSLGICAVNNNPEACLAFLNWFYTEDGIFTSNWGVQGEAYDLDENGEPYLTDLILNNQENPMPSFILLALYTCWIDWPMVVLPERDAAQYVSEAQVAAYGLWSENKSEANVYYGEMTADEASVYGSIAGDIYTYCNECILQFIFGGMELNQWDAYVQNVKDMGAEQLIEIKQAAYDRYMSR